MNNLNKTKMILILFFLLLYMVTFICKGQIISQNIISLFEKNISSFIVCNSKPEYTRYKIYRNEKFQYIKTLTENQFTIAISSGDINSDKNYELIFAIPEISQIKIINPETDAEKVFNAPQNTTYFNLSNISDLNDDGYNDIIATTNQAGQIAYFYSSSDLTGDFQILDMNDNDINYNSTLSIFSKQGESFIAIGCPYSVNDNEEAGKVLIYNWNDGNPLLVKTLSGKEPFGNFGATLAAIDITGDSIPELLISATSEGETHNGRVYIYDLSKGFDVEPEIINGLSTDSKFGFSLTAIDPSLAGVGGFAIGAVRESIGNKDLVGAQYWFNKTNNMGTTNDVIIYGKVAGDFMGWASCMVQRLEFGPEETASALIYSSPYNNSDVDTIIGKIHVLKLKDNPMSVDDDINSSVNSIESFEIFPNPTSGITTIKFKLRKSGKVNLSILDINGITRLKIDDKNLYLGSYEYSFNSTQLSSGSYYCRLMLDNFAFIRKIEILK
ncbi:MAG: T9SS type A sorting domain-containing protein [Bacteroidetes bacterium]|nr:MAG: T9SS type A sorting domain-containing protein [Bacteroidota bacterium]